MNAHGKLSRRGFLRTAAAVAAPVVLPSAAVRAAGVAAPSERIGLGFIGMGKMCMGHLSWALNNSGIQIRAVCDVERLRLKQAQEKVNNHYAGAQEKGSYTDCAAYTDFRELVARPDIDAVIVATPDHWHALASIAACRAGKDVYCEKPLAFSIGEARAIVDAVKRYGRVFQTGSQQRSEYVFRFASELVRNGRIGKLQRVHVNVGGPPADCYLPAQDVPESLDWELWLGPAPYRPYNAEICPLDDYKSWPRWRYYRDYAGGGMTDWGAHQFDIVQWALGMDDSGPVEILPPDGKDVPRLTYRYADGTTLEHGGGGEGAGVDFIGTKGRIIVNRGFLVTEPESLKRETFSASETHLYESRDHRGNWLDCIRTRRQPICHAEVGCRSVTVCHLGNLAYWLKRPLKWNPSTEQFVGDDEANRLIHRPMRAPWTL